MLPFFVIIMLFIRHMQGFMFSPELAIASRVWLDLLQPEPVYGVDCC